MSECNYTGCSVFGPMQMPHIIIVCGRCLFSLLWAVLVLALFSFGFRFYLYFLFSFSLQCLLSLPSECVLICEMQMKVKVNLLDFHVEIQASESAGKNCVSVMSYFCGYG